MLQCRERSKRASRDHAALNLTNWAPTHVSDSQVRVVVKVTRRAVSIERI
jgi:hypothetical protein